MPSRRIDESALIGSTFGRLTVVSCERHGYHLYCSCVCECGKTTVSRHSHMKAGRIKSCGCWKVDMVRIATLIPDEEIVGKRFGRLVVLKVHAVPYGHRRHV